jgi:hypothetical protein
MPGAAASPSFDFGDNVATKPSASAVVMSAAEILSNLSADSPVLSRPESSVPERGEPSIQAAVPAKATQNSIDKQSSPKPEISKPIQPVAAPVFNAPTPLVHASEIKQDHIEELALILWVGENHWFLSDGDSEFSDTLKNQLLLNVASAMGEQIGGAEVINFNWPFFGNRRLPGNDQASMLSLLLEWISRYLVSDELTGFLMGDKVTRVLLQKPFSDDNEMMGHKIELNLSDERGVNVVPTLSINEMLRTPNNKKQVWQHLKPFRIK